jgi:hypothetical protein
VDGKVLRTANIFYANKINELVNLLNSKLQENITNELNSKYSGDCPGIASTEITSNSKNNSSYATFNKQFANDSGQFSVTTDGIDFIYDFSFPRVVRACEPNGTIHLSYLDLQDYIDPNGVLGAEVK